MFAGAYAADVDRHNKIACQVSQVYYESTQIYKGAIIKCLLQQYQIQVVENFATRGEFRTSVIAYSKEDYSYTHNTIYIQQR